MQSNDIHLSLFTRQELNEEEFARQFLKLFFTVENRFSPEYMSVGNKWKRIGFKDVEEIARNWPRQKNIPFERRTEYPSAIALSMRKAANGYNLVNFWLNTDFFANLDHVQIFLDLCFRIYDLINTTYGYIHLTKDAISMSTVDDAKYGKTIVPINLNKGLPAIYWGNFFGSDYVSLIGKTKLMDLSIFRIAEMSDGGLFLRTTDSPLNINHEIQTQIINRIGQEFFYEWGSNKSNRTL